MAEQMWALRTAAGWASMSAPEQAAYVGYYENIVDWITAQVDGYDFVTNTMIRKLHCFNDWPGGKAEQINPSFTVTPTSNTTYRPVIMAAPGHECGGILGQGFGIKSAVNFGSLLNLGPFPDLTIDGFWFENTSTSSGKGLSGKCNLRGYRLVGKSASDHVFNNIGTGDILDWCRAAGGVSGYLNYNWENGIVKNSGATGCTNGFHSNSNGSFTVENCWSYGNTTNYAGTAYSGSSTNNAASDAATVTPPGSSPILANIVSGDFVDAANGDYHITSGSTLRGAGTNRYTDGSATDIDGDVWPNAAWDVGPDYYVAGGDVTPPTLTSPTGTSTGDTTADGSVTTDEGNGTLNAVVTTSATKPSVAQVQAGQDHTGAAAPYATSQAVNATGVQNVSATGLTPSTAYYWHYQQQDTAANDSTVVTSAQFTTTASADTTPDAYSYTDQTDVALSTLTTSNTITVTGIDASTPVSITGGEYSINGGAYTSASGNVVVNDTVTLRVTSSGSYYTGVDVNLDIGGVLDTWTVTTMAQPVGTLTLPAMKNNTGTVNASDTGITVDVYSISAGTLVERFTGETTDASGICAVSSVNLVASTAYTVVVRRSTDAIGVAEITAT